MIIIFNSCLERTLHHLSLLAKKDFTFHPGKTLSQLEKEGISPSADVYTFYKAPEKVSISPCFFRKFICIQCGWCCVGSRHPLEYLPSQLPPIASVRENFKGRIVKVNEIQKLIYVDFQRDNTRDRCRYSPNRSCDLHGNHPFLCRLEPIMTIKNLKNGLLRKTFPCRRWALREGISSKCKFLDFDLQQLIDNDIPLLREMLRIAIYLGIETWLSEIILYLETYDFSSGPPTSNIVIGENI